ncbi:hypothetical protein QBC40DRAFT_267144 [Triangularia verruculosa]|uniref:Hypersensitive response-inducing protein n=1 Tax=Triangularia verruculosa TaxID=2587418 RepID=A0AAN7ASZ3_9PEZI|nr:hypothetical protein QBC40DRAFT_267144 [Triangularia verruculosa]
MKSLTTILLTALLGTTATAAQGFNISEFTAGCIPHGTLCTIRFLVTTTGQTSPPAECGFSGTPLGSSSLPDTGFAACAGDPSIIWSFRRVQTAEVAGVAPFYELALASAEGGVPAASRFWAGEEFPLKQSGAAFYQQFVGEGGFVVGQ